MGLDFRTLGASGEFDAPTPSGKPLDILLSDIAENPDNPRTEFDDAYLAELAADIKANNVKSPVSIRKNPAGPEPWVLNYGACRYRASGLAGKATIPAFIDEEFTSYDAVAENQQRRNLTAMELALFIQKRIGQGEAKKVIAERLHIDNAAVSHHLALLDMPDVIAKAYREGRVSTARPVYDLVKLHKAHAKQVEQWLRETDDITRASVKKLADSLKPAKSRPELSPESATGETGPNAAQDSSAAENGLESPTSKPKPDSVARFAELPSLLVNVGTRLAIIVMERKPSKQGRVFVRYLDDDSVSEIKADSFTGVALVDSAELKKRKARATVS